MRGVSSASTSAGTSSRGREPPWLIVDTSWRRRAASVRKSRHLPVGETRRLAISRRIIFLGFSPLIPAVRWTLWPAWPYLRGRFEFEHLLHHQRRRTATQRRRRNGRFNGSFGGGSGGRNSQKITGDFGEDVKKATEALAPTKVKSWSGPMRRRRIRIHVEVS